MNKNDPMVDIETLGTEPGCVILSIGAAIFQPRGTGHGATFYRNIDLSSSLMHGLSYSQSTLEWWQKQSKEASSRFGLEAVSVEDAMFDFVDWMNKNSNRKFWCQGATFDAPLIEAVLKKLDIKTPWDFWGVRDTRTVYDVCEFNDKSVKREGTYHNALDDSIHQIKCVQEALRSGANR